MGGFPGSSTLVSYGGALLDYSPVIDPSTDLAAAGGNSARADLAGLTHTGLQAWVQLIPAGTGAPTIGAHDAKWGNALAVAPQPLRDGGGEYRIIWPTTVSSEIPVSFPGYTGPQALLLRAGFGQSESLTTPYHVQVVASSANVATIRIWTLAGALVDTTGVTFDIWMF